ncbi:MAG: DUF559 domain-containing protein [Chloroflexi bacterium]|nr:DUF559 domain-containing protein [Chloroflexota bacterium]
MNGQREEPVLSPASAVKAIREYLHEIEHNLAPGNATELTHRFALKALLEHMSSVVTATHEPKRVACGAPDFIVTDGLLTIGYVETKDVGHSLDAAEHSDQLKRYLSAFTNLLLTDYLEFRWYVDGVRRGVGRLGQALPDGKIRRESSGLSTVADLLIRFLAHRADAIGTPRELSVRMARLAQATRNLIVEAFRQEDEQGMLHSQLAAFRETLLPDLKPEQFADMYAQTIAYGLFAARANSPGGQSFTRQQAAWNLPKTNPFLRKLFSEIAGPDLDDTVAWIVDDLAQVLARADMAAVLKDFGKRTAQEDPVVHFYETFLQAYDPKTRDLRGVYYTPEPVVSYIVRSIDHLLKARFARPMGLADPNTMVLDPALGTGTFLYTTIKLIYERLREQNQLGGWQDYVSTHLLPRLFGFELLMVPYAVAHLKLGLLLQELGYQFQSNQRFGVYLTNTLEEAIHKSAVLFAQFIADEANAAVSIKRDKPIEVVLGNPPYSGHSANASWRVMPDPSDLRKTRREITWIGKLIEDYRRVDGHPLEERNPKWLQDDYVKFLRFAQWRIDRTGRGIVAMITNHGYLDNPTFRGMRQSLMKTFTDIYLLDLHGNTKKKERAPDGSKDENVFDIQQGVSIGIFVKETHDSPLSACGEGLGGEVELENGAKSGVARVHHADLWGPREGKYECLSQMDISTTPWKELDPQTPSYLFVPQSIDLRNEYEQGWKANGIFPVNSVGVVTGQDARTIGFTYQEARVLAQRAGLSDDVISAILYRPFDTRFVVYDPKVVTRPRADVMRHMLVGNNLGLVSARQTRDEWGIFATHAICGHKSCAAYDINTLFPLYLYAVTDVTLMHQKGLFSTSPWPAGKDGRVPNLDPAFVAEMERRLGMRFVPHPVGSSHPLTPPHGESPLATSPRAERGKEEDVEKESPSPFTERGWPEAGGEVVSPEAGGEVVSSEAGGEVIPSKAEGKLVPWHTPPGLWELLKPLARQMRKVPTPAEELLWSLLRDRQLLGLKFRRQHAIEQFVVDFYCPEARLIVEVDGPVHQYTQQEDAIRQEFLQSRGLRVLRFTNEQVRETPQVVLETITNTLRQSSSDGETSEHGTATFGPEDVFHYIYAMFHSSTYRQRYAEFLKTDFPRVPLTTNPALFRCLCALGGQLVAIHLLESPLLDPPFPTSFPQPGDGRVEKVRYDEAEQRVYINSRQYFGSVTPEVWRFQVGGYQVLDKWLKDRKGRSLTYGDQTHYQKIVVALRETIRLMAEIDAAIPSWPIG